MKKSIMVSIDKNLKIPKLLHRVIYLVADSTAEKKNLTPLNNDSLTRE